MIATTLYEGQKAVFANQDDGIFSAVPITFDSTVLTLETYTAGSRTFVKAGSVVKYGSTVKGITAEEYDITDGAVNGRVVLEGYVYVEALTEAAAEAISSLPKIVPIPYGKVLFNVVEKSGLDVLIRVSGSVWVSTVAIANFTLSETPVATISKVERATNDDSLLKITFGTPTGDGVVKITAVATAAVVGATGKVIGGLPISVTFKGGEVVNNA